MNTKAIKTALQHGANLWDDPKQGCIVKVYKGQPPAVGTGAPGAPLASFQGMGLLTPDALQEPGIRMANALQCLPSVMVAEPWALLTNEERVQKCYEMADEFFKQRNIYKR